MLIDTHCHLDLLEHKPLDQVLHDASEVGVKKLLCIGASNGVESCEIANKLSTENENIWASIGVHPHDADKTKLEEVANLASNEKVVAIGEAGLDFFREWSDFDEQRKLFKESITLAKELNKPLIIHCRDAEEETIKILKELDAKKVGGVFHCFGKSADFAKEVRELNFKISLTGIITFKSAHTLREEVAKIPLEQIMLETDCPYMAPEPYRGKPAEPMHVLNIAQKLADIRETSLENIAEQTSKNAFELFGI